MGSDTVNQYCIKTKSKKVLLAKRPGPHTLLKFPIRHCREGVNLKISYSDPDVCDPDVSFLSKSAIQLITSLPL